MRIWKTKTSRWLTVLVLLAMAVYQGTLWTMAIGLFVGFGLSLAWADGLFDEIIQFEDQAGVERGTFLLQGFDPRPR